MKLAVLVRPNSAFSIDLLLFKFRTISCMQASVGRFQIVDGPAIWPALPGYEAEAHPRRSLGARYALGPVPVTAPPS